MNPRRKQSVEELLRREMSAITLSELRDPRVGSLAVTRVELSDDQRSATVYLMARGSEEERAASLQALRHARGYVQHLIGTRLDLRYTPVLTFKEDKEVQETLRLENLIDEARREDREFRP